MRGCRALRASALADVRLDETVVQLAFPETFQHFHTVFQPVYKYLVVSVRILFCDHRLDHAAAHRIEAVDLRIRVSHGLIFALMQVDPFLVEPVRQLLKSKDRIHRAKYSLIPDSLLLFRDTGPEEDDLYIRPVDLLDIPSVGDHRGYDGRHQLRAVRVILLDQVVHARAACGDDVRHFVLPHQLFVFVRHKGSALRGLAHFPESQPLEGVHDLPRRVEFQHARIGRGDGYDGLKSLPQIVFYPLHVAGKCLCILRTDLQAPSAVDAVVHHDPRLLILDGDRFYRAVAHTFVTVTAFCIFKVNDLHPAKPPYFFC